MKIFSSTWLLSAPVAGMIALSACSGFKENIMNPHADILVGRYFDLPVEAEVVNKWLSGTKEVIQLRVINEENHYSFSDFGDLLNIEKDYWGSLNPQVNDCLFVWARVRARNSGTLHVFVLFNDRNPIIC